MKGLGDCNGGINMQSIEWTPFVQTELRWNITARPKQRSVVALDVLLCFIVNLFNFTALETRRSCVRESDDEFVTPSESYDVDATSHLVSSLHVVSCGTCFRRRESFKQLISSVVQQRPCCCKETARRCVFFLRPMTVRLLFAAVSEKSSRRYSTGWTSAAVVYCLKADWMWSYINKLPHHGARVSKQSA